MKEKIAAYLRTKVPGVRVTNFIRMPVGRTQETWFLDAEWQEDGGSVAKELVVRRHQAGGPLHVGTDRVTEFKVMKSLESTPVPVPRVYWAEADSKWLGEPFFIMDRVVGSSSTQELQADPELKGEIARQFVEILAALHTLDWEKLGLSFLGVPERGEDCAVREVQKWESIYRSQMLDTQPLLEEELVWVKKNAPRQVERVSLLWGDPGPGNFLYKDGKITGVVDWELAHLGDPMDDLGFLLWRTGRTEELMERQELLEYYERMSGIKVNEESIEYYQVLSNVRTAIMCHSAARGFCDGINLNPDFVIAGLLIFRLGIKQAAELMGL